MLGAAVPRERGDRDLDRGIRGCGGGLCEDRRSPAIEKASLPYTARRAGRVSARRSGRRTPSRCRRTTRRARSATRR